MSASQRRLGARELIDAVIDEGTYLSWDQPLDHSALSAEYQESLAAAAERSGSDESVITGQATIGGRDVALVVGEFRFLGGSIGRAAAGRVVTAIRRATAMRLPVVACVVAPQVRTPGEGATMAAYALTLPLVPPALALLAIKEKSRWSMAAFMGGAITVAVMALRIQQIWTVHA